MTDMINSRPDRPAGRPAGRQGSFFSDSDYEGLANRDRQTDGRGRPRIRLVTMHFSTGRMDGLTTLYVRPLPISVRLAHHQSCLLTFSICSRVFFNASSGDRPVDLSLKNRKLATSNAWGEAKILIGSSRERTRRGATYREGE